jgi:hypothetical protein
MSEISPTLRLLVVTHDAESPVVQDQPGALIAILFDPPGTSESIVIDELLASSRLSTIVRIEILFAVGAD